MIVYRVCVGGAVSAGRNKAAQNTRVLRLKVRTVPARKTRLSSVCGAVTLAPFALNLVYIRAHWAIWPALVYPALTFNTYSP